MEEIWKDIPGYEGKYQVSSMGRVKRLACITVDGKHLPEREKKAKFTIYGYEQVSLYENNIERKFYVHRLVADAFIPNPEEKEQVDLINTIKNDNRVENLRWTTEKENHNNPITRQHMKELWKRPGLMEEAHRKSANTRKKPVEQYTKEGEFIKLWPSSVDIERETGINKVCIREACRGRIATSGGFVWKYAS